MTSQIDRSPFAVALECLLEDTHYYSREEWAHFLGVSSSQIEDWITDKALPRSDLLNMLLGVLRQKEGIPEACLQKFQAMAVLPAREVSPLGAFMSPSVAEYMHNSSFAGLGFSIRSLPPEQQIRVLEGSWDADSIASFRRAKQ
jgi:hypothetical protein